MNLFTKRIGLLLTAVVGVGAIAALSIGASFSLFSAQSSPTTNTFSAGTVSLNTAASGTCTVPTLEPGNTGTCDFTVYYGGNLPAYIGAEATAGGVLAPVLTLNINGFVQPSAVPVVIGASTNAGFSSGVDGAGPYTVEVHYTLLSSADNNYQGQPGTITVTFYAVQCSNNLAGSSATNEGCAGPGPATWAVLYDSRVDWSTYQYSYSYGGTGAGELGNEVTLANGGGLLGSVTVDMANFNPTSASLPMTLNIYNPGTGGLPGSLIATDTQTFNIPAAPDGGSPYGGNTSGPCMSEIAADPYCGIVNFDVTFDFTSDLITLPGTVVYGIEYDAYANPAVGGVNVQLSSESGPNQVSVGSDTYPGNLFAALSTDPAAGNDTGPGEVTCSTVSTTFAQYSSATCDSGNQGLYPYVPAVEFDS